MRYLRHIDTRVPMLTRYALFAAFVLSMGQICDRRTPIKARGLQPIQHMVRERPAVLLRSLVGLVNRYRPLLQIRFLWPKTNNTHLSAIEFLKNCYLLRRVQS